MLFVFYIFLSNKYLQTMDPELLEKEKQEKMEEKSERTKSSGKRRKSILVSQYDWKLEEFSEQVTMKRFQELGNLEIVTEQYEKQKVKLRNMQGNLIIVEVVEKGSTLGKYTAFIIRGEGPEETSIEIIRKSADFLALREAFVRRWPGIIIPPFPDKLAVGMTDTQKNKNKLKFANNLLKRLCLVEPLYRSEEMEIFLKGQQNEIAKTLDKLKPHKPQQLLKIYSNKFPTYFNEEKSQEQLTEIQIKIKYIQDYLLEAKTDLCYQKDQLKKLAELKEKMLHQKYRVLSKLLPGYEDICLDWYEVTKPRSSIKSSFQKEGEQEEVVTKKIYGGKKYLTILGKNQLKEQGVNSDWGLYELLKFELKQIDALFQAINQYKLLNNERKFYKRNVQNNKKQIQDINNNKTSLKIMFLSGSTEEKKVQLANETEIFEKELNLIEEILSGASELMLHQIKAFMRERVDEYKEGARLNFQNEAFFMGKCLNMYVEAKKLS